MIEYGDIPSATVLTGVYEENFKVKTIKHYLRSKLIEAAENGI